MKNSLTLVMLIVIATFFVSTFTGCKGKEQPSSDSIPNEYYEGTPSVDEDISDTSASESVIDDSNSGDNVSEVSQTPVTTAIPPVTLNPIPTQPPSNVVRPVVPPVQNTPVVEAPNGNEGAAGVEEDL